MVNKQRVLRLIIVMIGFFLMSWLFIVDSGEIGLAVSVKPILPKNQHNLEVSYYDLRMTPGQEQDLELELVNTSDKDRKVELKVNDATTNDDGDIDYSDRSETVPRDKSLKLALKDIASIESDLIIPAKKTIVTKIHLKMPKNQFDGMILGGIKVVSFEKNKDPHESKSNNNQDKKTYIVAVKVTETDKPVVAELNVLDVAFTANEPKKTTIKATIQNNQAINLEGLEFTAKVYKKDSEKIYSQTKVTGYRMAPNSSFVFTFDENKQEFPVGKYKIDLTAKSGVTNQEWQWHKELEIKKTEGQRIVQPTTELDEDNLMLYLIIGIITFVLLLLFLLVLLIFRKHKEKQYEEVVYERKKKRDRNSKKARRNKKAARNKNKETNKKHPKASRRLTQ